MTLRAVTDADTDALAAAIAAHPAGKGADHLREAAAEAVADADHFGFLASVNWKAAQSLPGDSPVRDRLQQHVYALERVESLRRQHASELEGLADSEAVDTGSAETWVVTLVAAVSVWGLTAAALVGAG